MVFTQNLSGELVTLLVNTEYIWEFGHFGELDGDHIKQYDEDLITFLHVSGGFGELLAFSVIFDWFKGDIDHLFRLF